MSNKHYLYNNVYKLVPIDSDNKKTPDRTQLTGSPQSLSLAIEDIVQDAIDNGVIITPGTTYTPGDGIDITGNVISVDYTPYPNGVYSGTDKILVWDSGLNSYTLLSLSDIMSGGDTNIYNTNGTLTGDRTVNLSTHDLVFSYLPGGGQFSILSIKPTDITGTFIGGSAVNSYFTINDTDDFKAGAVSDTKQSYIQIRENSLQLFSRQTVTQSADLTFVPASGKAVFTSTLGLGTYGAGIEYGDQYHSTYTNRSLVDKEYVDLLIASLGDGIFDVANEGNTSAVENILIGATNDFNILGTGFVSNASVLHIGQFATLPYTGSANPVSVGLVIDTAVSPRMGGVGLVNQGASHRNQISVTDFNVYLDSTVGINGTTTLYLDSANTTELNKQDSAVSKNTNLFFYRYGSQTYPTVLDGYDNQQIQFGKTTSNAIRLFTNQRGFEVFENTNRDIYLNSTELALRHDTSFKIKTPNVVGGTAVVNQVLTLNNINGQVEFATPAAAPTTLYSGDGTVASASRTVSLSGAASRINFYNLASTDGLYFVNGVTNVLAKYTGDFHASYDNRTLVDKKYVDDLIAATIDGSGTTNFVTRWIDSDTLGDSIMQDNGTLLGINTVPVTGRIVTIDGSGTTSSTYGLTIRDSANLEWLQFRDDKKLIFSELTGKPELYSTESGNALRSSAELIAPSMAIGQVTLAHSSAALEVDSTTKGFLPPRVTTAQKNAIATPAEGLVVYDTDLDGICFFDGVVWQIVGDPLPTPSAAGQIIYWDGSSWEVATPYRDALATTPGGDDVTLTNVPIEDLFVDIYLNGVLQIDGTDYIRTADLVEFVFTFTLGDVVMAKYYF